MDRLSKQICVYPASVIKSIQTDSGKIFQYAKFMLFGSVVVLPHTATVVLPQHIQRGVKLAYQGPVHKVPFYEIVDKLPGRQVSKLAAVAFLTRQH